MDALSTRYGSTAISQPLYSGGATGMVVHCVRGQLDSHGLPRMCLGQTTEISLGHGDSEVYWFEAPYDGAFRFPAHFGDGTPSTQEISLYTQVSSEGQPTGSPRQSCGGPCTSIVGTRILSKGDVRYIRIRSIHNTGEPLLHGIRPAPLNDGSPTEPAWTFPDHMRSLWLTGTRAAHATGSHSGSSAAGSTSGFNNHSYYRFQIGAGYSSLRVYQTPCGSFHHMTAELYRHPANDPASAWDTDNLVSQVRNTDECDFDLDFDGASTGHYYVKIINHAELQQEPAPTGNRRGLHFTAH